MTQVQQSVTTPPRNERASVKEGPSTKGRIGQFVSHAVLMALVILSIFPIYYLLVNSAKSAPEFTANQWVPGGSSLVENYGRAWEVVALPLVNTIIVVVVSVAGVVLFAALAAYAFSIIQFPGARFVYWFIFILLLLPSFLLLIPLYLQIRNLPGVISGNLAAIILPTIAAGQAFSIVVFKSAFDQIPLDILDAARMDGANDWRLFRSVVLPMSKPVFASVAVLQSVAIWNDYLLPQLVLSRANATVSVALVAFSGDPGQNSSPDYGPLMAGYVLSAVPLVILFGFMMRSYINGLTSGAVKL